MTVADLKKDGADDAGNHICRFYARQPPYYAVYQTDQRVVVQYADDTAKADEQRKAFAQLVPMRGEINGLLQSWRDAQDRTLLFGLIHIKSKAKLRARADRYDRRMADALIVALEGDLTGAGEILKTLEADILDERVGWARLEYLCCSLGMAAFFILIAALISMPALKVGCLEDRMPLCFPEAPDMWRGAMAGAVGAFFSIALGIRGRTVLPDLHRASNLTDAALRVAIGIIAGMVINALILAKFVSINIGNSPTSGPVGSLYMALAGFLAGFSERMVPDLLASAAAKTGAAPVVRTPIHDPAQDSTSGAGAAAAQKPSGSLDEAVAGVDPIATQAQEDCCVSEVQLADDEITPDEALPAASGGVVASAEGRPA